MAKAKTKRKQNGTPAGVPPLRGRYHSAKTKVYDTKPVDMPANAMHPTPLADIIARMVKVAVEEETNTEMESWDEANDFDPEEEPGLLNFSPYTLTEAPDELGHQDPFKEPVSLEENLKEHLIAPEVGEATPPEPSDRTEPPEASDGTP